MNVKKVFTSIGDFFKKLGKRNLIIAGAVIMIGLAVYVNWIFFAGNNQDDSYVYDQSAGMTTNYGTTLGTGSTTGNQNSTATDSASYFSSVQISRQKARDEALEVLNSVVDNDNATDQVKAEALRSRRPTYVFCPSSSSCKRRATSASAICSTPSTWALV